MVWYRKCRDLAFFHHDNVAGFPPNHFPTKGPKSLDHLTAADRGQLGHQALTSTWHVCTVNGKPRSARTSKQRRIASRTFVNASALVFPWLLQPGIAGHSAIQMPSSSRSTVTWNFMKHLLLLHVAARKDARHKAEHVRRAHVAISIVADQPALDHVDLLLGRLVDHAGDQAGQLDRVLLVLEQF